jgi:predicted permease
MRATGAGGGRTRLRAALVVAQLAFSLVLLVCAGLLAQSVRNVQKVNLGFDEANMLLGSFNFSSGGYDKNRGRVFIRQLLDRVRGIAGVTAATVARDLPMNIRGIGMTEILIDGYTPQSAERLFAGLNYVGPQYFHVMRSELLSGRDFNSTDDENAAAVCIVNAEMVRRFWPGQQAIGKSIRVLGRWVNVVGVAPDLQYGSIQQEPRPYIYVPVDQMYTERLTVQARTSRDPASVAPALREAVAALDPQLLLTDVQAMTTFLQFATFGQRVGATLLIFFGGLALLLASVGLYGVVACVLRLRTREIGLRMALGATRREVLMHIMRNAGMLVAIGLASGAIMSVAAARILSSQLSGSGLIDPFVFAAAAASLGLFAFAAALLPAWRAVRVDPSVCLREG